MTARAPAIIVEPVDAVHRAIEPAWIDFRRRHEPFLDHHDPLADFELAHPGSQERPDGGEREDRENADDGDKKRADREQRVVHQ